MNKKHLILGASMTALLGCLALFSFGCGKTESQTGTSTVPAGGASKFTSAEKTSFAEVTAQLDPGGDFYAYLGTAQWLEHLATKVEGWRQNFTNAPDISEDNVANINKAFDIVNHLVTDSGIQDLTGFGASSIEIEKGMFRNKFLMHHYSGTGNGFLWKLGGKEPHALTGLDLLPANTALAFFSDTDLPLLWTVTQDQVAKSGFPQAQEFFSKLPAQFEEKTQLKWDAFLNSLGGECGFVLTLNESNTIPIPLAGTAVMIPEPGLLLVLKVKDDTIFNRIDQQLKANPDIISVEQTGLKMRTMAVPLPLIGTLRPSAASSGGYLFIASSDELVNEALAVKSGKSPGLKGTDEFKRFSRNIPDQGNWFAFMSERFGRTMYKIQEEVMSAQSAEGGSAAQAQWMKSFYHSRSAFCYCVGVNTPEGCLSVGNGSQSFASTALLPAIAVPGMLAAIAIPNFVKARATAQENACINNLRIIDAAKQQWALEKGKQATDVPTEEDLMPYIGRSKKFPVCPQGGTYTIGPVNEPPTCSIPGHEMPN
ncbi:MAG: hypothetical protein WDN00_06050 [Limisphaerales bacterium]